MPRILVDLGNIDNTRTFDDADYVILAENGNNTLTLGDGDNRLTLGGGNNTLTLGSGTDKITAGIGNNTITINGVGESRTMLGGGNNTVTVGNGPSVIFAGDGLNTITGGDGDNRIGVGDGINTITSGSGDSTIIVGNGDGNTITVGNGSNRVLLGDGSTNVVSLGGGDNRVFATAAELGTDSVHGALNTSDGSGNTLVMTSTGTVDPLGVTGFETYLLANGGSSSITLADGNFTRLPGHQITVAAGDAGSFINGINLSAANGLRALGGAGDDVLLGGAGIDTVSYIRSTGAVSVDLANNEVSGADAQGDTIAFFEDAVGGAGADTLSGTSTTNRLQGGEGADLLNGGGGDDVLFGGNDADTLDGGLGSDRMVGGSGNDIYLVQSIGDVVKEGADGGTDQVVSSVSYTLRANVENLALTGTAARGVGNELDNELQGNAEANILIGGAGNDVFRGGAGADRMSGGSGADIFVLDTPLVGSVDVMRDFQSGEDMMFLSQAMFSALDFGFLDEDAFVLGTRAVDAEDRIIYNSATGSVIYDADGSGSGAAIRFAVISPGADLVASDLLVFGV
jgi:serralysin